MISPFCVLTSIYGITTNALWSIIATSHTLMSVQDMCWFCFFSYIVLASPCPLFCQSKTIASTLVFEQNSVCLHSSLISLYIVLVVSDMSPAQLCKTNTYVGNDEQCMCFHSSLGIQLHQVFCTIPSIDTCDCCKCTSLVMSLAAWWVYPLWSRSHTLLYAS